MIKLEDFDNAEAPSVDYPYGAIKNDDGSLNGTELNRKMFNDIYQFFAKMFDYSGITANNLPDNLTNDFQLYEAFLQRECKYKRVYVKLSQVSTGAPTVENTFENEFMGGLDPITSYNTVGTYILTFPANSFPTASKVKFTVSNLDPAAGVVRWNWISATQVALLTYDNTGTLANGLLTFTDVSFDVYP